MTNMATTATKIKKMPLRKTTVMKLKKAKLMRSSWPPIITMRMRVGRVRGPLQAQI